MSWCFNDLGLSYSSRGDYAAARLSFDRALKIKEETLGPDHWDVALGLNNLGSTLTQLGNQEAAEPLLERSVGERNTLPLVEDEQQSERQRLTFGKAPQRPTKKKATKTRLITMTATDAPQQLDLWAPIAA